MSSTLASPARTPASAGVPAVPVNVRPARPAADGALAVNVPVPRTDGSAVPLDAEKLLAYQVALELQAACATLVPAGHRVLKDQLERASLSCVCCTAEGAGRRSRRDKRHYYMMARGSATESAAIIDVLRLRRLAPEGACAAARTLAVRVVQLLTRLGAALG
jgi:four helix bundle protein